MCVCNVHTMYACKHIHTHSHTHKLAHIMYDVSDIWRTNSNLPTLTSHFAFISEKRNSSTIYTHEQWQEEEKEERRMWRTANEREKSIKTTLVSVSVCVCVSSTHSERGWITWESRGPRSKFFYGKNQMKTFLIADFFLSIFFHALYSTHLHT